MQYVSIRSLVIRTILETMYFLIICFLSQDQNAFFIGTNEKTIKLIKHYELVRLGFHFLSLCNPFISRMTSNVIGLKQDLAGGKTVIRVESVWTQKVR